MKFSELQHKTEDELLIMLKEVRIKLGQLKFQLHGKTLKNVSDLSKTRKTIAQIITVVNQKHGK